MAPDIACYALDGDARGARPLSRD